MNEEYSDYQKETLSFMLDVYDDWPPIRVENIPCNRLPEGFQIWSPPLFVKGISVDDIITIEKDEHDLVCFWEHVQKSDHSTIWVLRKSSTEDLAFVLKNLRSIGCNTVLSSQCGIASVDVPGDVLITAVDEIIDNLDDSKVAVAYPSFRHEDN